MLERLVSHPFQQLESYYNEGREQILQSVHQLLVDAILDKLPHIFHIQFHQDLAVTYDHNVHIPPKGQRVSTRPLVNQTYTSLPLIGYQAVVLSVL